MKHRERWTFTTRRDGLHLSDTMGFGLSSGSAFFDPLAGTIMTMGDTDFDWDDFE